MDDKNISIKLGLDTTKFNNSLEGLKQEMIALERVDVSILSEEDAKAVMSRMGNVRASIKDMNREFDQQDSGNFFGSITTLAGPAIAAISAMSVGMELFGVETETVNKLQRTAFGLIGLISAAQTIADAHKLKALFKSVPLQAAEIKNRIVNLLLIKKEVVTEEASNVVKVKGTLITKAITKAQWLWNAAITANPIGLLIAGVAALAAGVYLLTKAFSTQKEEAKDYEKTIDGVVIKDEELRNAHNEHIKTIRSLNIELEKINGTLSEHEAALLGIENKYKDLSKEMNDKYGKSNDEAIKKSYGFWNKLKNYALSGGNATVAAMLNMEDASKAILKNIENHGNEVNQLAEKQALEKQVIVDAANKSAAQKQADADQSIRDMTTSLFNSRIKDEKAKLELLKNNRIKSVEESGASEEEQIKAMKQIWITYYAAIEDIDKKTRQTQLDTLNKYKKDTDKALAELTAYYNGDDKIAVLTSTYNKEKELLGKSLNDKKIDNETYLRSVEELSLAYNSRVQIQQLKTEKDKNAKLLAFKKTYLTQSLLEEQKAELDAASAAGKTSGASPETIEKAKFAIKKKYIDMINDYDRSFFSTKAQQEIDAEIKKLDAMLLANEDFQNRKNEILQKYADKENLRQVKQQETIAFAQNAMMIGIDMINSQLAARAEAEQIRLDEEYTKKYEYIDDLVKYGRISQQEADKRKEDADKKKAQKEKEANIKAAKQQKALALLNIAISAAVGVVKALENPLTAPVMIPLILGTAALSAAAVAAEPLPAFRTGSKEPFEETGNAYIHTGEMVIRPEAVSYGNNEEIIARLNRNPYTNIQGNSNGMTQQEVLSYINASFDRYYQIPVIVKEAAITDAQQRVSNVQVSAEF